MTGTAQRINVRRCSEPDEIDSGSIRFSSKWRCVLRKAKAVYPYNLIEDLQKSFNAIWRQQNSSEKAGADDSQKCAGSVIGSRSRELEGSQDAAGADMPEPVMISVPLTPDQMKGLDEALGYLTETEKKCIAAVYRDEIPKSEVANKQGWTVRKLQYVLEQAMEKLCHPAMYNRILYGAEGCHMVQASLAAGADSLRETKQALSEEEQRIAEKKQGLTEGEQRIAEKKNDLTEEERWIAETKKALSEEEQRIAAKEQELAERKSRLNALSVLNHELYGKMPVGQLHFYHPEVIGSIQRAGALTVEQFVRKMTEDPLWMLRLEGISNEAREEVFLMYGELLQRLSDAEDADFMQDASARQHPDG